MLKVYHSNQLERLIARLADLLTATAGAADPFTPETILVQSNGMRRWVAMQLARRLGICANLQFPYPAAFLWQVYRSLLPAVPETSPFDSGVLTWRLLGLFNDLTDAVFKPLHDYLERTGPVERYQLACRIADVFDQYLVYRPDWIATWEAGQGDHWQAALWRRLATPDTAHRARLQQSLLAKLDRLQQRPANLPARLACIGIATLPAAYLDTLHRLARFSDIHLFLLNPCRQYWGLILAEREIARRNSETDAEALYLETGNRLLASWGRQGRDFHHLLAEVDAAPEDLFSDVPADNLLHCLQTDILDLHNRGGNATTGDGDTLTQAIAATPLREGDLSLQIHVCHSPMREVEVLHDRLLDLFQQHPHLTAADVVVMTPDIETYAPAFRAVFGAAEREHYIPFSIADRGLPAASSVAAAFLNLLALPGSRYTVNQVMDLLAMPVVYQRFGLGEAELATVTQWLQATAIRWGIDDQRRAALDLPATREHSWQAGLQRLLLGFALPAGERRLYRQVLPFDAVEGSQARILGRLLAFLRALFALDERLATERPVSDWQPLLLALLDDFMATTDELETEREALRLAVETLGQQADLADFRQPLPLAVIRTWLTRTLQAKQGVEGFLGGGVTCCAMVPMRSIPFPVVCLLGLNHDSYPRPQRPVDFDLVARHPRRGDRSRRQDDRYLFLEALLSARQVLYLSYVGSDIRDNTTIPPSVLVSELLDYIRHGFHPRGQPDGDPLPQFVTRHPLQPFSRRYFEGREPALFSYSQVLCTAAQAQGRGDGVRAPTFAEPLPEPEAEFRRLDYRQLIRFFHQPCRYLLEQRLRLRLQEETGLLADQEPFLLEDFADRTIRETLFDLHHHGGGAASLAVVQAKGLLPHGEIGRALYAREQGRVQALLNQLPANAGEEPQRLEVNLMLVGVQLNGWLDRITTAGLHDVTVHALGARQYLDLWIRHLLLNALRPDGVALISTWQGLNGSLVLLPVAAAEHLLEDLLTLYWQGLQAPLKFFPRTSLAFVQASEKQDPWRQARDCWEGSEYTPRRGESEDRYYQFVFRDASPLDDEFAALARRIYLPLLASREPLAIAGDSVTSQPDGV